MPPRSPPPLLLRLSAATMVIVVRVAEVRMEPSGKTHGEAERRKRYVAALQEPPR